MDEDFYPLLGRWVPPEEEIKPTLDEPYSLMDHLFRVFEGKEKSTVKSLGRQTPQYPPS